MVVCTYTYVRAFCSFAGKDNTCLHSRTSTHTIPVERVTPKHIDIGPPPQVLLDVFYRGM
jgi:hypothetical protein